MNRPKLVPLGEHRDAWMLEPPRVRRLHDQFFSIDGSTTCHIQRKPNGQYGFNSFTCPDPRWLGPEFDSIEACLLYAEMVNAYPNR
jgi:hypothetical protein